MKLYLVNGLIKNSVWGDFCSADGPNVTISQTADGQPENIELNYDSWYDVEITTFDRETIILVLALINNCEPEEIALEESDVVVFI